MKAAFAAGRDLGDLDGEARAGASDHADAVLGEFNQLFRHRAGPRLLNIGSVDPIDQ